MASDDNEDGTRQRENNLGAQLPFPFPLPLPLPLPFLTANLTLGVDDKTRHWKYDTSVPRTEKERTTSIHSRDSGGTTIEVLNQPVYNGRNVDFRDNDLTLDACGFELVNDCFTKLSRRDFYDLQEGDAELAIRYNKEIETYVAKKLECDFVICVQSQVRNSAMEGTSGVQGYAEVPHTDSSPISSDVFCLNTLRANHLSPSDFQRYCYLNVWRNISDEHPVQNHHLAVLDERTLAKPEDCLALDVIGDGFEVTQYRLSARHANHHRWYCFPRMTKHEAILFKQMDSDWTLTGRICFHTSVPDPAADTNAVPPRESIEIRMLCFWKDAAFDSMPTNETLHRDAICSPKEYAIELKQRKHNTRGRPQNQKSNDCLESASLAQLLYAVICRLPVVRTIFGGLFLPIARYIVGLSSAEEEEEEEINSNKISLHYSGNPSDYLGRFIQSIDSFPTWHASSQAWAKIQMRRHEEKATDGIRGITRTLVEDSLGYQGTRNFLQDEKTTIVSFLLDSDEYTNACNRHLVPLLAA